MRLSTKISIFIGCSLFLGGCIKDDNFDIVPKLEFESFELYYNSLSEIDSATYSFSFKDGDGDIGAIDSVDFNCFLEYQEKNGDSITLFPSLIDRKYSLPNLTPNAQDKNIEGVISLILKPAPINNIFTDSAYRHSCYIVDRAGNESNKITSNWVEK